MRHFFDTCKNRQFSDTFYEIGFHYQYGASFRILDTTTVHSISSFPHATVHPPGPSSGHDVGQLSHSDALIHASQQIICPRRPDTEPQSQLTCASRSASMHDISALPTNPPGSLLRAATLRRPLRSPLREVVVYPLPRLVPG